MSRRVRDNRGGCGMSFAEGRPEDLDPQRGDPSGSGVGNGCSALASGQMARAVGPVVAEAVRRYGGLASVEIMAFIIEGAAARDPLLQELGEARISPEEALELAESVRVEAIAGVTREAMNDLEEGC